LDYSHESQDNESESKQEPPSLIVGRDHDNHWIVVETHGLCGGIFANEAAAMHYAREESRGRPGAVRLAPSFLALNISGASQVRLRSRR
jgi:hypothetical protein